MKKVIGPAMLYQFLLHCERSTLDKNILDCGAGGPNPPLSVFRQYGYVTRGIEISESSLSKSAEFCKETGMELGITRGDMRNLPFGDCTFSFVYSYNSVLHMVKEDIRKSVNEMIRVLKKDGLLYFNLLSVDDCGYGDGEKVGNGEFSQDEDGEKVTHSYYEDCEADGYCAGHEILLKQKRLADVKHGGKMYRLGFIDYMVRKH